jgi:hypothetical protein
MARWRQRASSLAHAQPGAVGGITSRSSGRAPAGRVCGHPGQRGAPVRAAELCVMHEVVGID